MLVVTCVREGEQSAELQEYFNVLDSLVSWNQTHPKGKSKNDIGYEFERDIEAPALLDLIERTISVSPSGMVAHQRLMGELKSLLYGEAEPRFIDIQEADLGFDIKLDDVSDAAVKSVDQESGETGMTSTDRWHKRAQNLKVGDVVEYTNEKGVTKRMSLIWIGEDSFKFVFVNRQGMKEVDLDIDALASQLSKGKATLVDENEISLIDKTLFNTVQSVYKQMSYQATHDPLTKAVNRREFEKHLTKALAKAHRDQMNHALYYIDLDQFGVVNNNYGYEAGDGLLTLITENLREQLDNNAILARIGGNEFGVLALDCGEAEAGILAERILKTIDTSEYQHKEETISITASIGLELITPDSQCIMTLMKHANLACISAKKMSGAKFVHYEPENYGQSHQDSVMNWVVRIDKALGADLLQLRCQKIAPVENPDDPHAHYEVLLGVLDEDGNLTSPESFIEAAEQFRRMPKVDRWVVNTVFDWMENNPDTINGLHGLSVNLSGHSINDDSFLEFLSEKLANTSVAPEKICFEVTETATISNLNYAADFVNELKKSGCKFSLDDFGTGLASYEYLQKLPVDYLKIDGVFIKDIHTNMTNYAMVKSINEVGHFMGKETIAEYVENDEILEVLREIGIDHAQGYGIQKPVLMKDL